MWHLYKPLLILLVLLFIGVFRFVTIPFLANFTDIRNQLPLPSARDSSCSPLPNANTVVTPIFVTTRNASKVTCRLLLLPNNCHIKEILHDKILLILISDMLYTQVSFMHLKSKIISWIVLHTTSDMNDDKT